MLFSQFIFLILWMNTRWIEWRHSMQPSSHPYSFISIFRQWRKLLLTCFVPYLLAFSPELINDIDIVSIREIRIAQKDGEPLLDTTIVIRNSGANTIKFTNCTFELAVAAEHSEELFLGTAQTEEILLQGREAKSVDFVDSDVRLAIRPGTALPTLAQTLVSTPAINRLMTQATPQLQLHLRGRFDVGLKAERAWGYQQGVRIDWLVTPEIHNTVLASAIKSMLSGTVSNTATPADRKISQIHGLHEKTVPPSSASQNSYIVLFGSNQSNMDQDAKVNLAAWWKGHQENSGQKALYLEGHGDLSGTDRGNQNMSLKRVRAVYDYLFYDLGVTAHHVVMTGFGKTRPLTTDSSPEAQAANRRVEIFIRPIEP
ncbi:hypothetical protein CSA57_11140 [candidate division KSB3 bacterium]|nr:MAG: hypothetical protein CSA57_11140 [candidate division KSB3 bacterium]